jgi:hypothetical protein
MNLLNTQNRIVELMSIFVTQVKGYTAMTHTDINHIAETVLIPLFREVYGFQRLKNLNSTQGANYPGIDLGDEEARVAFQITSTSNSDKINHTLELFTQYKLYEKYDRLIVYILSEKQRSYSGKGFAQRIDGKFCFDKDRDILDFSDLLAQVKTFQLDKAQRVERILETNFGNGNSLFLQDEPEVEAETVFLNLLEMSFPNTLYIADVALESSDLWDAAERTKRGNRFVPTRDLVRAALKDRGLTFAVDWVEHANQIITFHDLRDETLPLHQIIDLGTIAPLAPEEFYSQGEDLERVFKDLLRRCLQQKLYHQQVHWQNEDHLFIFMEVDDQPVRKEQWEQTPGGRTVYERVMKNDKPGEIYYCKHFAFQTQFYTFNGKWYVSLKPDWFFSRDGYHRWFYGADRIKYLKKKEKNRAVFNHLRFIAYFLAHDKPSDLFTERQGYRFLSFGNLPSFDNAPALDDKDWLPGESKEEQQLMVLDL